MPDGIRIGDRFRHFKTGNFYRIVGLFTWEPTLEPAVLYESEASHEQWGRPLTVFLEMVASPTQPDAKEPRFKLVEESRRAAQNFSLVETHDPQGLPYLEVYSIHEPNTRQLTLKDGHTQVIGLTFLNMSRADPQRGDAYMSGVIAGCVHMTHLRGLESTGNSPPVLPFS